MQIRKEEANIIQQEKDNLYRELKESRFEVATVTQEKDKIKDIYEKQLWGYLNLFAFICLILKK
jgi:hypothetical protein